MPKRCGQFYSEKSPKFQISQAIFYDNWKYFTKSKVIFSRFQFYWIIWNQKKMWSKNLSVLSKNKQPFSTGVKRFEQVTNLTNSSKWIKSETTNFLNLFKYSFLDFIRVQLPCVWTVPRSADAMLRLLWLRPRLWLRPEVKSQVFQKNPQKSRKIGKKLKLYW